MIHAHGLERSNAVATRSLRTALEFHDSSRLGCLREDEERRIEHTYEATTIGLHLDVVVCVRSLASLRVVYNVSVGLT